MSTEAKVKEEGPAQTPVDTVAQLRASLSVT